MPVTHLLLALLVVTIWGINFIFAKLALTEMSPFFLCALRFLLASIPAIFFIKPPTVPFRVVIAYGLIMFGLQFLLFFMGMNSGMTAGMASVIMQVQVFFSLFFAAILLEEIPNAAQISGALVSFLGIGLILMHVDKNVSLIGSLFILSAAGVWGLGNLITKKNSHMNMMALVIWGSFIASFPMIILSLWFDGIHKIVYDFNHMTLVGISALLYIVYASTWVGYGTWNWLVSRYPIGLIVPFTLLIPIVGMISSVLILGEPLQTWKLISGLLVISGLCINILGARFLLAKAKPAR